MNKRKNSQEDQIQRAIFQHIALRPEKGVFAFHPANGGYRSKIEAAILQGLGVKAGVPDIIIIKQGQAFALELKREKARASERQLEVIRSMQEAGAICSIAYGIDEALRILESWKILKGKAQ